MKDLGYMNGWTKTPKIVEKCEHNVERTSDCKCVERVTCNVCGYTYCVDSSD